MSEGPPAEPTIEPAVIDFDRAEIPEAPAGVSSEASSAPAVECRLCKRAITTEYWEFGGILLCESCRAAFQVSQNGAKSGATFAKAALAASAVALACGAGYAVFVGLTKIQFALVTIGIGWAIGRTIHRFTRGFGSVRYQVLAVVLTYFAGSMGYLGAIVSSFAEVARNRPDFVIEPWGLGVTAIRIMIEAPFLELKEGLSGLLGLAILFFGMRTAWRVSKGAQAVLTGPHRVRSTAVAG